MTHDRTYRPFRCVSAPRLQGADGSMRQAPRRSAGYAATHPVQPLKGLPGTRATDISYRALAPGGAGGRRMSPPYRALAPAGAGGRGVPFSYRALAPAGADDSGVPLTYRALAPVGAGDSGSRPTANY